MPKKFLVLQLKPYTLPRNHELKTSSCRHILKREHKTMIFLIAEFNPVVMCPQQRNSGRENDIELPSLGDRIIAAHRPQREHETIESRMGQIDSTQSIPRPEDWGCERSTRWLALPKWLQMEMPPIAYSSNNGVILSTTQIPISYWTSSNAKRSVA